MGSLQVPVLRLSASDATLSQIPGLWLDATQSRIGDDHPLFYIDKPFSATMSYSKPRPSTTSSYGEIS